MVLVQLAENMMTLEEYDIVKGALDNADRWDRAGRGDVERRACAYVFPMT